MKRMGLRGEDAENGNGSDNDMIMEMSQKLWKEK